MDATDRKLLSLLQEDGTRRYADLGKALHLSAPAVHERVKKLRKQGVIERSTIAVDSQKLGLQLTAFIHVLSRNLRWEDLSKRLQQFPEVQEVHSSTGDTCFILKVGAPDTASLEELLQAISSLDGVLSTCTYVVLQSYLQRGPSPLLAGGE